LQIGGKTSGVVYSTWFRAWVAYLHRHADKLKPWPNPSPNKSEFRDTHADLFKTNIPMAQPAKRLCTKDQARLARLWPEGEHEASHRLASFVSKISDYAVSRKTPAMQGATSALSVHLAAGTLSARHAVKDAAQNNIEARGGDTR